MDSLVVITGLTSQKRSARNGQAKTFDVQYILQDAYLTTGLDLMEAYDITAFLAFYIMFVIKQTLTRP